MAGVILSALFCGGSLTFIAFGLKDLKEFGRDSARTCRESTDDLVQAAAYGDEVRVRAALDRDPDANHVDSMGNVPLSCATEADHIAVVRLLLERGAAVDKVSGVDGHTPLSTAIRAKRGPMTQLLLDHNARLDLANPNGRLPLAEAVESGSYDITRALLDKGADPNQVFPFTSTPVILATSNVAQSGLPLAIAIGRDDFEMARLLVDRGADANRNGLLLGLVERKETGRAKWIIENIGPVTDPHVLMKAAEILDDDLVLLLLQRGADPNVAPDGPSALVWASAFARPKMVNGLLAAGADPNFGGRVPANVLTVAFDFASQQQNRQAGARYLTASPQTFFDGGNVPPIVAAATWGHDDIVTRLLAAGADPNMTAGVYSALHLATIFHHTPTVRVLLDAGARPAPNSIAIAGPVEIARTLGYSDTEALFSSTTPPR